MQRHTADLGISSFTLSRITPTTNATTRKANYEIKAYTNKDDCMLALLFVEESYEHNRRLFIIRLCLKTSVKITVSQDYP